MEETTSHFQPARSPSANRGSPRKARTITQIFFVLFCLEVGFVLVLLPWTFFWDNNYFVSLTPELGELWLSSYLRGGVSGVGLVNIWIGVAEARQLWH